jgi:NTE family protein
LHNPSYFDQLLKSVTRIARHSYFPGKEEAVEQSLDEIQHLRDCEQITEEQLAELREVLLGEEGACLREGVARERSGPEAVGDRGGIAIVCQGIGSQAAFSAGVLQGLLELATVSGRVSVVGGEQFGGVNALLAWEGLLRGNARRGIEQIQNFWDAYSARSLLDTLLNYSSQMVQHLRSALPVPGFASPVEPLSLHHGWRTELERLLDIGLLRTLAAIDGAPRLVLRRGAPGGFSRCVRGEEITLGDLLSTPYTPHSVPTVGDSLIRGVARLKPAEIWLIELTRVSREEQSGLPRNSGGQPSQFLDPLLELELEFIQKINVLLERGSLIDRRYRRIEVHRIIMEHDLDEASMFDRSPSFIGNLMLYGRERARQFLEKRKNNRSCRLPVAIAGPA